MFRKLLVFLFGRKAIKAKTATEGKVSVEMVVTRANGTKEVYVKDSKGQRRISG